MSVTLDRFPPPEAGPHRPVVGKCAWCGGNIEAGDEVWEFSEFTFGSYDCLHDWVQEETAIKIAVQRGSR